MRRLVTVTSAPVILLAVLIAAIPSDPPPPAAAEPPGRFEVYDEPRPLPPVQFQGPQGNALTLKDFRGRVVLLNVWATWCPPCREEMPSLDRLQATLGGPEFVVVPMSIDRKGRNVVKAFYDEIGIEHLGIYLDPDNRAAASLGAFGVPVTLLIDKKGREIGRMVGATEWDTEAMVRFLRDYIEKG